MGQNQLIGQCAECHSSSGLLLKPTYSNPGSKLPRALVEEPLASVASGKMMLWMLTVGFFAVAQLTNVWHYRLPDHLPGR